MIGSIYAFLPIWATKSRLVFVMFFTANSDDLLRTTHSLARLRMTYDDAAEDENGRF
jgi:hypothetical protein